MEVQYFSGLQNTITGSRPAAVICCLYSCRHDCAFTTFKVAIAVFYRLLFFWLCRHPLPNSRHTTLPADVENIKEVTYEFQHLTARMFYPSVWWAAPATCVTRALKSPTWSATAAVVTLPVQMARIQSLQLETDKAGNVAFKVTSLIYLGRNNFMTWTATLGNAAHWPGCVLTLSPDILSGYQLFIYLSISTYKHVYVYIYKYI